MTQWIHDLCNSGAHEDAARHLFEKYDARLRAFVAEHIAAQYNAKFGASDVVQEGLIDFFQRRKRGQYEIRDRAGLLALLKKIVLNKAISAMRAADARKLSPESLAPESSTDPRDDGSQDASSSGQWGLERQRWGESAGTWAYMSPEQIRGQDLEPRSDLWSLGAVFYQMLTGRPPFPKSRDDDTDQLKKQIQTSAHLAARGVKPDVPETLSQICDRCLEKSPGIRYATAADLAAATERWLAASDAAVPRDDACGGLPRNIPDNLLPRSESFVGRTRELDDLREQLHRPGVVGVTQQVAAHGHGGGARSRWRSSSPGELGKAATFRPACSGCAATRPIRPSNWPNWPCPWD